MMTLRERIAWYRDYEEGERRKAALQIKWAQEKAERDAAKQEDWC